MALLTGIALGCLADARLLQGDADGAHENLTAAMPHLLRAGSETHVDAFLASFALVATARQQYGRAATLHGAIERMRADHGEAPEPQEARLWTADVEQLRHFLGGAAFDEYYERGEKLTRDQTIALALSDRES